MTINWTDLIQDSEQLSNVTIVCEDGIVTSHKIIVASISNFIKDIISDIPVGDDITIYLLDCKSESVKNYLQSITFGETFNDRELDKVFIGNHFVKTEQDEQDFVQECLQVDCKDIKPIPIEMLESKKVIQIIKNPIQKKKKINSSHVKKLNKAQIAILKDAEERVVEMESNIIQNPETTKDRRKNMNLKRKIQYEKARADYKAGKFQSVYSAAKAHNLNKTTLLKLLKNPEKTFTGLGKIPTLLTVDEEKFIVDRAIERTKNGEYLDFQILYDLVLEEINTIQVNHPDRDLSKCKKNFIYNFSARHNLKKYFKPDDKRRDFGCEICYKKFTLKNALVAHQRAIHPSFYLNYS